MPDISDVHVHAWPSQGSHDDALNPVICNGLEKSRHTPARVSLGKHAFVRQHYGVMVDVPQRFHSPIMHEAVLSYEVVTTFSVRQRSVWIRMRAKFGQAF